MPQEVQVMISMDVETGKIRIQGNTKNLVTIRGLLETALDIHKKAFLTDPVPSSEAPKIEEASEADLNILDERLKTPRKK